MRIDPIKQDLIFFILLVAIIVSLPFGIQAYDRHLELKEIVLLGGLYLGLSRCLMGLKHLLHDRRSQIWAMVLPSVFALLAVNLLLKLYMG
jgi:hypothetical protein